MPLTADRRHDERKNFDPLIERPDPFALDTPTARFTPQPVQPLSAEQADTQFDYDTERRDGWAA